MTSAQYFPIGKVDLGITFHVTYVPIKTWWVCVITHWTWRKGIPSCLSAKEVSSICVLHM